MYHIKGLNILNNSINEIEKHIGCIEEEIVEIEWQSAGYGLMLCRLANRLDRPDREIFRSVYSDRAFSLSSPTEICWSV